MSRSDIFFQGRTYAERARGSPPQTDRPRQHISRLSGKIRPIYHGSRRGKRDESVMRRIFDGVTEGDRYKAVQRDRAVEHNLIRLREESVKTGMEIKAQLLDSEFSPSSARRSSVPTPPFPAPSFNVGEGAEIRFRGKIDRIDRCRNKFIIIDYKRGQSVFKEKEL